MAPSNQDPFSPALPVSIIDDVVFSKFVVDERLLQVVYHVAAHESGNKAREQSVGNEWKEIIASKYRVRGLVHRSMRLVSELIKCLGVGGAKGYGAIKDKAGIFFFLRQERRNEDVIFVHY